MRFSPALSAIALAALAVAGAPAMAQPFGVAFVHGLCANGAYTLDDIEEPQYMALGDTRISFQDVTGTPILYQFVRQGGVSSCEQQTVQPIGGVPIRQCSTASVTKDGRQLTRAAWVLASCSAAN
ncbi:MAG: hypothetical protein AB7P02_13110 [Alphaproteobacteria bacterium]